MAYSNKAAQKKYHQNWYKRNRKRLLIKARANNKLYIKRNREFIKDYKESRACLDCGKKYHPCAMDFDHIKGIKKSNIAILVRMATSISTIKKEIDKCELVCANCHRLRTHKRIQDKVLQ
jgi:hypothetical protein